MLLAVANLADFGIAVVGSITAIVTVLAANHKQNQKLDKVERSMATTNGKTSGQYVEETYYAMKHLEASQQRLQRQFSDHSIQDATAFASIEAHLEHIAEDAAAVRERVAILEDKS